MKFYILNLPFNYKIIRKYSCSYYANGFLYPPYELLRVASIIKNTNNSGHEVKYKDAIAENCRISECIDDINTFKPDLIITLISVDFINEEMEFVEIIKSNTGVKIIGIGYLLDLYRTQFSQFDAILGNDFENKISHSAKNNNIIDFIHKLNTKNPEPFFPDIIQAIDETFLNKEVYYEFLTKGPTAFTYFSFGCPYNCSFCIKTYHFEKIYYRDIENIKNELLFFYKSGYKNVRFLDDNCTLNKKILFDLKNFIIENNILLNFYGLTRLDLIDKDTVDLLKAMNFKRIFIGVESTNYEIQKTYNKVLKTDITNITEKINILKSAGIETGVFLMFNPLLEGNKEIIHSIKHIKKTPALYANISYVTPYPGTDFFTKNEESINLTFIPHYKATYKTSKKINKKWIEYYFLISFYIFNKNTFLNTIMIPFKYPENFISILKSIFQFRFRKSSREDFI